MATIPKLALIPSGYKDGKLYSVLPTDGSGDLDFERTTTATRINSEGLIEEVLTGVPRLNYPLIDGVVNGCPSLLLENSATNLFPYSGAFDNWSKNNGANIISNNTISPDGTLNADKFNIGVALTSPFILYNSSVTATETYTQTIYAKSGDEYILQITGSTGFGSHFQNYNLSNGTLGNSHISSDVKTSIEYVGNGWYRCSYTAVCGVTTQGGRIVFTIVTEGSGRLSGKGLVPNKGLYIYGAMLEQNSFNTSYIPTNGGIETRLAETANGAGNASTFNDSEGVLMAEISALADDGTDRFISLTDGGNDNRVLFGYRSSSNQVFARIEGSNSASVDLTNVVNDTKIVIKLAIYYDSSFNYKMYLNGFLVDSAIGTDSIIGLNTFNFTNAIGTENFYGKAKQLQYFNTALTDSELETLTSYSSFNEMALAQNYIIQ